ncbi:predicted coding region AF_0084 [Archaeoglobus fulgidus DSM 4304]|jgi:predicted DNA-binding protein|uniref:Uncharacterized protein AF_0084 n=3 Tax=Archaeoglobus fulgidus TaxID=2234 RepID=Y084_ARCFU|nr:RecName: Full=Uncharacterized protein AF_0084 [Archaeoglobus fulgidus DSM 4304]AAB91147.1 predicted coding region AF_0084 [Archaeoglobus fulgidus DSM 4304]
MWRWSSPPSRQKLSRDTSSNKEFSIKFYSVPQSKNLFILPYTTLYMQRYIYPVDLTEVEDELNIIVEKLKTSKAEAIREAIRHYAEELRGLEVVELRDVPKEQAKEEVKEFIKGKERVWADEIADALRLDLSLVNDILMELWSEGYVEPED